VHPSFVELAIPERRAHCLAHRLVKIAPLENTQLLHLQNATIVTLELTILFQRALPARTALVIISLRQARHHANIVFVCTTIALLAHVNYVLSVLFVQPKHRSMGMQLKKSSLYPKDIGGLPLLQC